MCVLGSRPRLSWCALLSGLGLVGGCSFPSHEFVSDAEFERRQAVGGAPTGQGGLGEAGLGLAGGSSTDTPTGEICDNGLDDDADGDADCLDADCVNAGWGCAPEVPSDWIGPLALFSGTTGSAVPECRDAGAYPVAEYAGLVGEFSTETWSCPSCNCGAPAGASATVRISYRSGGCTGACALGSELCGASFGVGCNALVLNQTSLGMGEPLWLTLDAVDVEPGSCEALTEGALTLPPGSGYAKTALACASGRGKGVCGAGGICVPRPAAPFAQAPCIAHPGDVECPSGYAARREVFATALLDQRGCTACACDVVEGVSRAVQVTDFSGDFGCDGASLVLGEVNGCIQPGIEWVSGLDQRHLRVDVTSEGGRCTPLPSTATGQIGPSGETLTFCCTTP